MDEGNSVAEKGVEGGVSYVEKHNLGTVTKQFLKLDHGEPYQASEKCIRMSSSGSSLMSNVKPQR